MGMLKYKLPLIVIVAA